ncbi:YfhO family protein [uncultured Prevotella sp.]|uniref:YfhO family protein n=1 Tax=uncultured Prevotella sp. TaxID=159272 RepID=UPI00258FCC88|nr:YfhO family protein [uncultured Prevotella sp.]
MKLIKQWLPDVLAVVFFAVLAFAYFYPADVQDRVLSQGDVSAGMGMGEEASQYYQKTGERTRWTNSLFSGMPTYQISPSYDSTDLLSKVENAYHLWLPDNVWYLFVYLLGFYILLRAFDFRQQLAALGSVLWAFSTYFLIIIAAGHLWKVMALAYLPPMIGGIVLAFRKKYLWGLLVTALFGALEIHANHVQMTYYYLFVILLMVLAFIVDAVMKKEYAHIGKALGVCIVGGLLGVMVNASNLYHTWQYSKETMRGKSELVKKNTSNQTDSGLERSYITDYSYGIGETWTLLVPNTKGGTSMHLLFEDDDAKKAIKDMSVNVGNGQVMKASQVFDYLSQQGLYFTQYWEENLEEGANGTMGPVYVGAFVLMLAVLCLLICYRNPLTWGLLAATLLSIMLAWGKNFMGLTDLFIDYMPMYAKFRAVESILVIAEFTIPLMAMLALKELVISEKPQTSDIRPRNLTPQILIAFALTGGIALLFAVAPTMFFDFYTDAEANIFHQILPPPADADALLEALSEARQAVFTADCWRSFFIIVLGTLVLLLYRAKKLKTWMMAALLLVICLVDLWQVNRRYLNPNDKKQFMKKVERQQIRPLTEADQRIMDDPTLYYRVLNLAPNVFNENETSYYHKSVGGYHAAKLRRYQELIERYISGQTNAVKESIQSFYGDLTQVNGDSIWNVLNMLNTKYFLLAQQNIEVQNPYAYGNAWFVDKVKYVDNANQELDALGQTDLRHEAVADKQFQQVLGEAVPQDSTSTVELTAYEPNQLTYSVESKKGGVLVFSEIYYPGWTATVDGEEVELGRVNYVLRAMPVTAGHHEVVLSFFPKSLDTTETLAYVALTLILLCVVALIVMQIRRKPKA